MTGKEASQINHAATGGEDKINEFLANASARDIQEYLQNVSVNDYHHARARSALEIRISEDQLKAAEILQGHTTTLIGLMQLLVDETKVLRKLTVRLLILTVGLLVFTIYLAVHEYLAKP